MINYVIEAKTIHADRQQWNVYGVTRAYKVYPNPEKPKLSHWKSSPQWKS